MATSWEQAAVNAQMEINRIVFELNRPGALKTDPWYAEKPDLQYILEHVENAIEELEECRDLLPGVQRKLFARRNKRKVQS